MRKLTAEERQCTAPRCTRVKHKGGLCGPHTNIAALGLNMWAESVWVARRLTNIRVQGECWIWQGNTNNMGYGMMGGGAEGKSIVAHRWFFERFVSPIPRELVLDHLCRTPLCVNPKHLEPVTLAENTRRGFESRGYGTTRTHCAHGHPWTAENIFIEPGRRPGNFNQKCRPCKKQQDSDRHRANRANRLGAVA